MKMTKVSEDKYKLDCGCTVLTDEGVEIVFCVLHKSADDMLKSLKSIKRCEYINDAWHIAMKAVNNATWRWYVGRR